MISSSALPSAESSVEKAYQPSMLRRKTFLAVHKDSYSKGCLGTLAASIWLDHVASFVVAVNAIWIAFDVDLNKKSLLQSAPGWLIGENLFCLFFVFEVIVRWFGVKNKRLLMRDYWFWFDLFLAVLMAGETWILSIIFLIAGIDGDSPLGTFTSMLRMLRLLRLARIVKLLGVVPELTTLISAFAGAIRSVVVTLVLLLIVVYVFTIALVQTLRDSEVGDASFGNVLYGMYILTKDGIIPDSAPILQLMEEEGWLPTLAVMLFIVIATFAMLNMLVGILCDVAIRVSAVYAYRIQADFVRERLGTVMRTSIDADSDGLVSKDEFLAIITNDTAVEAVKGLGVDVAALVEQADMIFDGVDAEGQPLEHKLTHDEFMDTVVSMRPNSEITLKDIAGLRQFVDRQLGNVQRKLGTKLMPRKGVPSMASSSSSSAGALSEAENRGSQSSRSAMRPTKREADNLKHDISELQRTAEKLINGQAQLKKDVLALTSQWKLLTRDAG